VGLRAGRVSAPFVCTRSRLREADEPKDATNATVDWFEREAKNSRHLAATPSAGDSADRRNPVA
jgi:hypothetical protein